MNRYLNTHARIKRALRNNQKVYSAGESFKRFRWFTLGLVILLPIYPSLAIIGSDYEVQAGDYDETTIITAYEGDEGMEGSYINKSGLISTDFDVVTAVKKQDEVKKEETGGNERAKSYKVVAGDTLSSIAKRNGITQESLAWANDLDPSDVLSPGATLRIPPVSGVVHKVAKGDTISAISAKYHVDQDEIFKVNNMSSAATLKIGMKLMIPGAAPVKSSNVASTSSAPKTNVLKPVPTETPGTKPTVVDSKTGLKSRYAVKYTGLSRGFAWGNCTWYVAQNKSVTWRGNANAWLKNAKAKGVATGQKPVPGSIVQFTGRGYNRYYGHVGIVADVTDEHIIVKDMNYRKINEVTIRKVPRDDPTIDGYIYID
ncbi:LysM peptidoglycan-binding domain-containing protein [Candidatus Gracilibacteria bacterium]|nr:LysM peptidoglycan-binding domain-containing protein [Candidatus Gracilibacteria bacterium]